MKHISSFLLEDQLYFSHDPVSTGVVSYAISATVLPTMAALADGDTPASQISVGSYTSTAGTIISTEILVSVNDGVETGGTTAIGQTDVVAARILVTDSVGNIRSFGLPAQTVPVVGVGGAWVLSDNSDGTFTISSAPAADETPFTLQDNDNGSLTIQEVV